MKLDSDFVGELAPEAGCGAECVAVRFVVVIARGSNFEADLLRKEVLMLLL
jgi:hypothetical protein